TRRELEGHIGRQKSGQQSVWLSASVARQICGFGSSADTFGEGSRKYTFNVFKRILHELDANFYNLAAQQIRRKTDLSENGVGFGGRIGFRQPLSYVSGVVHRRP